MLRLLAEELRFGVGEYVDAVVAIDGAEFAAWITRQARMGGWIDVAGAHALAHFERRGAGYIANYVRIPLFGQRRNHSGGQRRRGLGRGFGRTSSALAGFELGGCDEDAVREKADKAGEPFFVIAHPQIFGCGDDFARVARGVDIPL